MNICYLANCRFPSDRAHAVQIVEMCNAFAELGHAVTLVVTDRATDITEDPERYYGRKFLFRVLRVAVPDMAGQAERFPVWLRPALVFFQQVVFAIGAVQKLRAQPADCIYGREEWILWLVSFILRTPMIWESHEARFSYAARVLTRTLPLIVVISEGIRDFYIGKGVPSEKICVAHDAVDARFFEQHISTEEARKALGISSTKPVVMYIGGLDAWKGADTLFSAVHSDDPYAVYCLGGKPEEVAHYQVRYPFVHFLGSRPYRELARHQQAADVLVIPNTAKNALSSAYTSPLKLFAYMTARKPIIASRIPSIMHVLRDDEVFYTNPDDPEALRATMLAVLNNPQDARERAEKAYERSHDFTWKKRAESITNNFARMQDLAV